MTTKSKQKSAKFRMLDVVELTCHISAYGLSKGMIGTVGYIYKKGKGCMVEFAKINGDNIVFDVTNKQIKKVKI